MSSETIATEPFQHFKAKQREIWAGFAANEGFTTLAAAELVAFAKVQGGESVLDVGCGTGVVAVTAARHGASVKGLDLTPVLLERARENAAIAGVEIEFIEGDAEALPYPDASFDVVLSISWVRTSPSLGDICRHPPRARRCPPRHRNGAIRMWCEPDLATM